MSSKEQISSSERRWAIIMHTVGAIPPAAFILWIYKRRESSFLDITGKRVLNFQLTWIGIWALAIPTLLIVLGLVLIPLVGLIWTGLVTRGAFGASRGQVYDYPLTLDLLSTDDQNHRA